MGFLKRLLGGEDTRNGLPGARIAAPDERSVRSGRPVGEGPRRPQVVGHVQVASRASSGSQALHGAGKAAPERQPQRPSLLAGGPAAEAALAAAAAAMAQPFVEPSPPSQRAAPRVSSQPKLLAQQGHSSPQLTSTGSGAAPVSPNPAAPPPVLRRASSTCPAGLHSAATTHSSSAADDGAPAAGAGNDSASREGSRSSRSCGMTAGAAASGEALLGRAGWWGPAMAHQADCSGAAAGEGPSRQTAAGPPAARWHPAMGPLPAEHATPAWVHKATQQHAALDAPVPTTTVVPPPPRVAVPGKLPANDGSPSSPLSAQGPAPGSSLGTVSMLTFALKGPSAASSAAASRESSVRSGIKRQPGGLTLALSRENSIRGGAARDASVRSDRERSVRDGSHRSASARDGSVHSLSLRGAGGRQEGSVLAQWGGAAFGGASRAQQQQQQVQQQLGLALQGAQQQGTAAGCGSGDWMGLAPVSELLAVPPLPAGLDPFAAVPAVELSSNEPDELELLPLVCQPLQPEVGSWAKRVTTFPHRDASEGAAHPLPKHACGPDPLLLTAALQALVASPSSGSNGSGAASTPGPSSGPGCNMLVGDSELATTGSGDPPSRPRPAPRGGSPPRAATAAAERRAVAAAEALAHSWDGAREAAPLPLYPVLGGSAPALGCAAPADLGPGSASLLQQRSARAPGPEATAASQEWNRSFMRRWREVKKRAYLQALGLRALWRVHSLSDRHEPLELLTNDLPQYDNGMRRAWSSTRLAAQQDDAQRRGTAAAQTAPLRRAGPSSLHKDPSLSTLLLGEVAEVC